MAKVRKAARGKRRWVGLGVSEDIVKRGVLESIISDIECLGKEFRLYDFNNQKVIIRLPLSQYYIARPILEEGIMGINSITSSGKIKLVRERLGLEKSKR